MYDSTGSFLFRESVIIYMQPIKDFETCPKGKDSSKNNMNLWHLCTRQMWDLSVSLRHSCIDANTHNLVWYIPNFLYSVFHMFSSFIQIHYYKGWIAPFNRSEDAVRFRGPCLLPLHTHDYFTDTAVRNDKNKLISELISVTPSFKRRQDESNF